MFEQLDKNCSVFLAAHYLAILSPALQDTHWPKAAVDSPHMSRLQGFYNILRWEYFYV